MDALTYIHWTFGSLEAASLVIFIYFVVKYTRRFQEAKDPYTIACFIFIIIGILIKLIIKLYSVNPFGCGDDCFLVSYCTAQISYYLPTGIFTVAILINVFRWILITQTYQESKNTSISSMTEIDENLRLSLISRTHHK